MKHALSAEREARAGRRAFLQAAGAVLAGLAGPSCGGAGKPNIVWIVSDDVSPELGCYGYPLVETPHIDRLASQGRRYDRAYVTAPVCSASRSALMTGMHQTSIGAHHHRSHRDDGYRLPPPVRLITDYLREAGYFTVSEQGEGRVGNGKTDFNFHLDHEPFDGQDWSERAAGQPFFAFVNINEPHRGRPPDVWSRAAALERRVDPDKVTLPPYYPDHPIARRDWASYLDYIHILDGKVGRVLDRLESEGLANNTVVFFFGDHGRPMPRCKQFLYEGGIRIPFIARWPGEIAAGSASTELVSTIDIAATSLAIAGAGVPEYMEGRPFLGRNVQPREFIVAARDRCDETMDRIRCIRDERYKYIRNYFPDWPYMQPNGYKIASYPIWRLLEYLDGKGRLTPEQALFTARTRPREELYDLDADPHELRNLAGSPEHAPILETMRERLDRWVKETGDQGEIPEDPAIAERWAERMRQNYGEIFAQVREMDAREHARLGE